MKRSAAALAIMALALTATSAQAAPDPLAVARHVFGDKPCVHTAWTDTLPVEFYPGQVAEADADGCTIWLVTGRFGGPTARALNGSMVPVTEAVWCQVIVHEYGHTVGHTHDDDIPVMRNPWTPGLIPECSPPRQPPVRRGRAWRRHQHLKRLLHHEILKENR